MNQGDLFGGDEVRERLRKEMDADKRIRAANKAKATRLTNAGIAAAADHAEATTPGWHDAAMGALMNYAKRHVELTIELVKDRAYEDGLPMPPNPGAWGSVTRRAIKAGHIVFDRFRESKNPSQHKKPVKVWRSMIYGGEK